MPDKMLNDNDFMVSSGWFSTVAAATRDLYEKANAECESRGCKDFGIGNFQVISEVNQGSMMYLVVAHFWYG